MSCGYDLGKGVSERLTVDASIDLTHDDEAEVCRTVAKQSP